MTQVFRCQHALAERGGKTAFRHVDLLAYIVIGIFFNGCLVAIGIVEHFMLNSYMQFMLGACR